MRFSIPSTLLGVALLAGCGDKPDAEYPFVVTPMNCALFASRYDLYGASNAAANIRFKLMEDGKSRPLVHFDNDREKLGFFARMQRFFFETSMEDWIEARVNSRNEKSLNNFSQACVTMLQQLGSK